MILRLLPFLLFLLAVAISCYTKQEVSSVPSTDTVKNHNPFYQHYDITDLAQFNDTTRFIGRLIYKEPFGAISIIEVEDMDEWIYLLIKQPRYWSKSSSVAKRSYPFNQLCYTYEDEEAQRIIQLFRQYSSGKVAKDNQCPDCLDTINWQVEVYDRGKYSSLSKDYLDSTDRHFTDTLLVRAHLIKENKYRIRY